MKCSMIAESRKAKAKAIHVLQHWMLQLIKEWNDNEHSEVQLCAQTQQNAIPIDLQQAAEGCGAWVCQYIVCIVYTGLDIKWWVYM